MTANTTRRRHKRRGSGQRSPAAKARRPSARESGVSTGPDDRALLMKDLRRVFVVGGVLLLLAIGLSMEGVREQLFNIEELRQRIHAQGSLSERLTGYSLFIGITSVLIAVGLPRMWVSVLAGSFYGALLGTALGFAAAMVGATGTYYIGKSLFRSIVRRRLGKRLTVWNERFRENAVRWTVYARLLPFTNATLTSLICGSCNIRFRHFLLANAIGFLPTTTVFAMMGSGAAKANWQLGAGIGAFLLAVLFQFWWVRRERSRLKAPKLNEGEKLL